MSIRDLQMLRASTNCYPAGIDGDAGPLTWRGVGIVQRNGGERFRH